MKKTRSQKSRVIVPLKNHETLMPIFFRAFIGVAKLKRCSVVLRIRNDFFFSDPDPTFQIISDPDPA